jgi:hypothetical protein
MTYIQTVQGKGSAGRLGTQGGWSQVGLDYNAIVEQVRNNTGNTFQYVAFSVTAQQLQWMSAAPTYPSAFISPAGKDAEPNQVQTYGDFKQWITEAFSVCVLFQNQGDLLAQDAATQVPLYREKLRSALVGWHPLPATRTVHPLIEGDDNLFVFEGGARSGWLFNYSQRYQISTPDGYVPPSVPLILSSTIINSVLSDC